MTAAAMERCRRTGRCLAATCTACSTIRLRLRRCCAGPGCDAGETIDLAALREASLERLADAVEAHLDTNALLALLGEPATCKA